MALDERLREPKLSPEFPDLVLEELSEGFDQFEVKVIGETTHVVMGLDGR